MCLPVWVFEKIKFLKDQRMEGEMGSSLRRRFFNHQYNSTGDFLARLIGEPNDRSEDVYFCCRVKKNEK